MKFNFCAKILFFLVWSIDTLHGRSPLRLRDTRMPEITAFWSQNDTLERADQRNNTVTNPKQCILRDYCLEYHPIFSKYDKAYFMEHLLPDEPIPFRNNAEKKVTGEELKKLAEHVLVEIHQKKKKYTHFTIIHNDDFNVRTSSGLTILKYKQYPFVLKLFIKTPETFVKPFSEGLYPKFFFRMGGGTNRHLTGFTRIRNLEEIRKKIDEDPYWAKRIDTPRKWFWLPEQPRFITIVSKNLGPQKGYRTEIPAVYGIIADEIQVDKTMSLLNKLDREEVLAFAHYVGNRVDAHVTNFLLEKSTGKIVLIDTEHFPSMIGLKEPLEFDNYSSWYVQLSLKGVRDIYLRHKKIRTELQTHPTRELFPC